MEKLKIEGEEERERGLGMQLHGEWRGYVTVVA